MIKKQLYRKLNPIVGKYFNKHDYEKKSNNIFIFSTARSGSTILMELFYSQDEFSYRNEPFHPGRLKMLKSKIRPYTWEGVFSGNKKSFYLQYMKKIINGELIAGNPTKLYEPYYNFFTNRLVFKILRRKDLIWFFCNNLDGKFIFLIRHPIPTALSWIKNGYKDNIKYILKNESYISHLNSQTVETVQNILKTGSYFEKMIVEWCLENKPVLSNFVEEKCFFLTYEEIVKHPIKVVEYLSKRYELEDKERMIKKLLSPSSSTKYSDKKTRKFLENKKGDLDRSFLIKKWKKEVSQKQICKTREILEEFEINIYESKKPMPRSGI